MRKTFLFMLLIILFCGCTQTSSDFISCSENWECSYWSSCVNGQRTRTCSDLNNCNTELNKPALFQSCSGPQVENLGSISIVSSSLDDVEKIKIYFYNESKNSLYFTNKVAFNVSLKIYAKEYLNYSWVQGSRLLYSSTKDIGEQDYKSILGVVNVSLSEINYLPGDYQYAVLELTLHTPSQGDFTTKATSFKICEQAESLICI